MIQITNASIRAAITKIKTILIIFKLTLEMGIFGSTFTFIPTFFWKTNFDFKVWRFSEMSFVSIKF